MKDKVLSYIVRSIALICTTTVTVTCIETNHHCLSLLGICITGATCCRGMNHSNE
jgi:hypothetical protein